MASRDPFTKFNFRLEIDGITPAGFHNATGLSWETEVLEFPEGGRNDHLVRLPGQGRLGKVSLSRGFTGNAEFHAWARSARENTGMRRTVDVVVLDDAGEEAARYTLFRAWPSKFEAKEFAGQSGIQIESLELSHEGILKGARSGPRDSPAASSVFGPVEARLQAASQAARDAAREARNAADSAVSMRNRAEAGFNVAASVSLDPGGLIPSSPAQFLPAPPAVPSGASALDAAFRLDVNVSVPSKGEVVAGARDAMIAGVPPASVTAHAHADDFAGAMADAGPPPSPAPAPPEATSPSSSAGFAASGTRGSVAGSTGAWSDGVSRQQPPGEMREPPIQTGSPLHF